MTEVPAVILSYLRNHNQQTLPFAHFSCGWEHDDVNVTPATGAFLGWPYKVETTAALVCSGRDDASGLRNWPSCYKEIPTMVTGLHTYNHCVSQHWQDNRQRTTPCLVLPPMFPSLTRPSKSGRTLEVASGQQPERNIWEQNFQTIGQGEEYSPKSQDSQLNDSWCPFWCWEVHHARIRLVQRCGGSRWNPCFSYSPSWGNNYCSFLSI